MRGNGEKKPKVRVTASGVKSGKTPKVVASATTPAPRTEADEARYTSKFLARATPLADHEIEAFSSQCSDAEADRLGRQTVGEVIAREGRSVLKRASRMLKENPTQIRYGMRRLTFLAMRLRALESGLEAQRAARTGGGTTRTVIAELEKRLREARAILVTALEEVLEGDTESIVDLAALRIGSNDPQALIDSANAAMALAIKVLERPGPTWKVLREEHQLTAATVDATRRASRALAKAVDAKSDERIRGDTPVVNRAEGQVIFEIRKLHRALDQAHQQNALVERLTLGPALRRMVGHGGVHATVPTDGTAVSANAAASKATAP